MMVGVLIVLVLLHWLFGSANGGRGAYCAGAGGSKVSPL
jgi:hypothetical protein